MTRIPKLFFFLGNFDQNFEFWNEKL